MRIGWFPPCRHVNVIQIINGIGCRISGAFGSFSCCCLFDIYHFQIVCKDNFKYELNSPDGVLPVERPEPKSLCGENYIVADRLFLILSPILFLIFNVIYWLTYCSNYILEF